MWQPMKEPVFRALWISAFISNVGGLMQDVAAAWLMTSLTTQPLMVALLQTAANAPFFVLGMVSGALADVVDRRVLLIIGQAWMGVAALVLGIMTVAGVMNPWWLLALTFVMGLGAAVTSPAWNALVPELVARDKLEQAIALNSVGYNTARGVGSAAGGIIVSAAGSGAVFLLNSVSFLGVIGVLLKWKRPAGTAPKSGREPLFSAIKAGMRFAQHTQGLRAVFVKTSIWASGTSAMWALLPLIAREQLKLGSTQYGLLLAAFGVGTLLGAFALPRLRQNVSLETTARIGFGLWAGAMTCMALSVTYWLALLYMAMFGAAWIIVNSSLNIAAQLCVASWVRARALALYILIFQGSVALSSMFWGRVGDYTGLSFPLLAASALLATGLIISGKKFHLGASEGLDTSPSGHWIDPDIVYQPLPHHGPVMVTCEYTIDPSRAQDFAKAISILGNQRKRDGAYQWNVFCDLSEPSRYVETFLIENWGEHCRQHDRAMAGDIEAEKRVDAFHLGEKSIKVRHFVSAFTVDMDLQLAEVQTNK